MQTKKEVTDNLDQLLQVLPPSIRKNLEAQRNLSDLIEVVLDLGREPEARFPDKFVYLENKYVFESDLEYVTARVSDFGKDNRAGIERTLHRISAVRNRQGKIIGLTCRVGRAIYGTIDIIRDIVEQGKSILLLGRPGVGKTTKLREVARVLSDELLQRVIIVDTSNEIAGDGDVPHPAIGHARRMQVASPELQHDVMIEAVENHMPQVVIVDEIGTALEAFAARTIAERGVQLIATAHGNTLDNLIVNPTLSDLVGGIQTVTLSDEEAKRRGSQKSVLERKGPPAFDLLIEIMDKNKMAVHHDLAHVVDQFLRGVLPRPEIRVITSDGLVEKIRPTELENALTRQPERYEARENVPALLRLFPYGISRNRLERAIRELRVPVQITKFMDDADMIITTKAQQRREPRVLHQAEETGKPLHILRSNTVSQIASCLREIFKITDTSEEEEALSETEEAIEEVVSGQVETLELRPRNAYIRRLQHQLIEEHGIQSESIGRDPYRRVRVYKEW